ncbi:MAG: hypothetical protein JJ892_03585 [Balneola sp.]|nr:hypothetical protein [Balneola sp.]MBO6869533.1 hypothetical protein [Balneola sp.]
MNIFPEAQKDVDNQIVLNTVFYSNSFYIKPDIIECSTYRFKSFLDESILNKVIYNEYCLLNYKSGSSSIQEFSSTLGWAGISNLYITNLA